MAKIITLTSWRERCSLDAIKSVRVGWSKARQRFLLQIDSVMELSESWLSHVCCILHPDDGGPGIRCRAAQINVDATSAIVDLHPLQGEHLSPMQAEHDPFFPFASVTLDHFQITRTFPNATSKAAFEKRSTAMPDDDFPFND